MSTMRYHLNSNGEPVGVEEPGRCPTYWWLHRQGKWHDLQVHLGLDDNGLPICPDCQAWVCRCDEISAKTYPGAVEPAACGPQPIEVCVSEKGLIWPGDLARQTRTQRRAASGGTRVYHYPALGY